MERLEDALADCQRGLQLPAQRNGAWCEGLLLWTRAIIGLVTGNPVDGMRDAAAEQQTSRSKARSRSDRRIVS
jgi:hypothetical protein